MSDTQATNVSKLPSDPATPATPAARRARKAPKAPRAPRAPKTPKAGEAATVAKTGRASSWSKEDTFNLLEELLEVRRNREFFGPKDRAATRVFQDIADRLQNLHPSSDPHVWTGKRVRNKHDDLAHLYKFWYIASNFSGCHADRITGKISYEAEEVKDALIKKEGMIIQRVFRMGLLCRENFNLDQYDEVFSNVIATGNRIIEIPEAAAGVVVAPPVAEPPSRNRAQSIDDTAQDEEDIGPVSPPSPPPDDGTGLHTMFDSDSDFPEDDDLPDPMSPTFIRPSRAATDSVPSSSKRGSKRAAASGAPFDNLATLLQTIRRNKKPKSTPPNSNSTNSDKPELTKVELAMQDVTRFTKECCDGPGISIIAWLLKDPTSHPIVWLALESDSLKLALLQKIGVPTTD
ncbi:hypothetical protein E4U35_007283 [Claviceps purpurea]|nr:hypothetical protein E4U51_002296 [Claviceps purpurea]KAG6197948.1 hypothetical protein E4U35_007283 [Claviceps purpurea]KAG6261483.1 hypothetical protein E4U47_008285 [Claviceps purpurea]